MSSPTKDPLDVLQSLIDDVLIHTGKALRSARKDGHGHPQSQPQPPGTLQGQPKIPETIRKWHCALDELEFEILKAKSVLLRDLHQVQERKRLFVNNPEPQSQSQSQFQDDPITINLVSPTSSTVKAEPDSDLPAAGAPKPLMAPFPNMSIDLPSQAADTAVKGSGHHPPHTTAPSSAAPSATLDVPRPHGVLGSPISPHHPPNLKNGAPAPSGMTFTNMEFSLAPPLSTADPPKTTADPPFASTSGSFTPSPADTKKRPGLAPPYQETQIQDSTLPLPQEKVEDKNGGAGTAAGSSQFQDLFGNDSGAADGMDFDFSLGGGEETFDALMNGRHGALPAAKVVGNVSNGGNISNGNGNGNGNGSGNGNAGNAGNAGGGGMSSAEFDAMMMNLDKPAEP